MPNAKVATPPKPYTEQYKSTKPVGVTAKKNAPSAKHTQASIFSTEGAVPYDQGTGRGGC